VKIKIIIIFVFLFLLNNIGFSNMNEITRPATVAGSFYPDDKDSLKAIIERYFDNAEISAVDELDDVSGIISPHAGYVYSGNVAAYSFKILENRKYDAAIIIAPSHQKPFTGCAIFPGDNYQTPFGKIPIDKELSKLINQDNRFVFLSMDGHEWNNFTSEHSLEVQLPFLQYVQPNLPIVPIVMGSQDDETCSMLSQAVIKAIKKMNKKVLIVASTDLSHFHSQDTAKAMDKNVISSFEDYDYFKLSYYLFNRAWEACGAGPVISTMLICEELGANKAICLKYATSADTPDGSISPDRVVGYFSGVIGKNEKNSNLLPELTNNEKAYLKNLAKSVVESVANNKKIEHNKIESLRLNSKLAAFVTINKHKELRACMGHIFSSAPLIEEVIESASIASTQDYRFGKIKADELNDLEYEVSVLSRMKLINDFDEIEIGKHGLYIKYGNKSGLLLPQVASERKWDRDTFLSQVCLKAGLAKDFYLKGNAQIFIFEAIIID
jgi:MEMO1 family protein